MGRYPEETIIVVYSMKRPFRHIQQSKKKGRPFINFSFFLYDSSNEPASESVKETSALEEEDDLVDN